MELQGEALLEVAQASATILRGDLQMRESEIIEAVASWFNREFGAGFFCGECRTNAGNRADLLFVRRADSIHVVEAKARAEDFKGALKQLKGYLANYRWLALPRDSYESYGGGIASACSECGYGLLLVSGKERHRVEVRRQPEYIPDRFDNKWPRAFNR